MFDALTDRLTGVFDRLSGRGVLSEKDVDEVMREILREYFRRHALSHVDEADFRAVVNDVSGADYDWFFDQWLHTTARLDYAVAGARTAQAADGRWRTQVTVRREGEAWMPVTVQVGPERVELRGQAREQVVEVTTAGRPTEVVLDPERKLLEADVGNNRKGM